MARKGQKMYALTPCNCLECKVLIPVGVRRPNQTLCLPTKKDRRYNKRALSRCQTSYYNKKKQGKKKALFFIYCDTCHKKIQTEDTTQVRCVSDIEGELSDCQIKAKKRISKENYKAKKERDAENTKVCLKCDRKFVSNGDFNRICDRCQSINSRVSRKMHKLAVC